MSRGLGDVYKRQVIETIVLLNVLWICTTPLGTLRLDFFEPVFFAVAAIVFNLILQFVDIFS